MSVPVKLAAFAGLLAVLFAGGALAGAVIDPHAKRTAKPGDHAGAAADPRAGATPDPQAGATPDPHAGATPDPQAAAHPVRGLAVAEEGLRLVLDTPEVERNEAAMLRFRIVGEGDAVVRDFEVEHEKRMHLIVVRRDLTGFQHLHPRQAPDGTWSTELRVADAGSHRVFADFTRHGENVTLAGDLRVDGDADLRALPWVAPTAVSDGGLDVRLEQDAFEPGREARLRFAITRDGEPVATEPYLGAGGHLVALREGDLAYLHVHPTGQGGDDGVAFEATFPTPGRYRLFLQFRHEGRIHTVAFTRNAG